MSVPDRWSWPAPAKLNLFLHVVGRRADGYHRLQTVFQIIDWCDDVQLAVRGDGLIERVAALPGVAAEDDLCVRAARALQRATGTPLGAEIALTKRIPMGGGLGGGSSDAASVLVGLNEMWRTGLNVDDLAAIGLQLGADVPVFVRGDSAFGEGIGEILVPLSLPESWFVIVHPGVHVATPQIFSAPELTRDTPLTTIARFLSGESTRNDLETVVRARYVAVDSALNWLNGFASARMSGSGACVFAAVADEARADAIVAQCPKEWRAFTARGRVQSPLRQAVLAYRADCAG